MTTFAVVVDVTGTASRDFDGRRGTEIQGLFQHDGALDKGMQWQSEGFLSAPAANVRSAASSSVDDNGCDARSATTALVETKSTRRNKKQGDECSSSEENDDSSCCCAIPVSN